MAEPLQDFTVYDFTAVTPEDVDPTGDFIGEDPEPDPEPPADDTHEPDPGFIVTPKRGGKAVTYERKIRRPLNKLMRVALAHPNTVPDGAALIAYGPQLSATIGDLAAADDRAARMVDFVTEGSDNPYANVLAVAAPLILQLVRNHEPQLEPAQRGIRVPFTKRRIRFKFGIKLGRLRPVTNDPEALTHHVLTNPGVVAALQKAGIDVAQPRR